jgi:murein DD-endopeptidase MepM/ murein hydrolase activator NlpD
VLGHLRANNGVAENIKKGDLVSPRTVVGYVGNTGKSDGPHLHIQFMKTNDRTNILKVGKEVENTNTYAYDPFDHAVNIG